MWKFRLKKKLGSDKKDNEAEKESFNNVKHQDTDKNKSIVSENKQKFNNIMLDNNNNPNIKMNNQLLFLDSNIIDKANKCTKASEIDKLVFNVCKNNKELLSKSKMFVRNFEKLYNNIKLRENHLKYIFNKFKKLIFPETLDEIFEYSKK